MDILGQNELIPSISDWFLSKNVAQLLIFLYLSEFSLDICTRFFYTALRTKVSFTMSREEGGLEYGWEKNYVLPLWKT